MSINKELIQFIRESGTAFQAVATVENMLKKEGFTSLMESEAWELKKGGKYYTKRNDSSLIAFAVPEDNFKGFMMSAAHADNPCYKVKENEELEGSVYIRLSTEEYGGSIHSTWMDRPLSTAGRLIVRTKSGFKTVLVDVKEPIAMIPNLCIHMNRDVNKSFEYNNAVDMIPLYRDADGQVPAFREMVAAKAGVKAEDIISTDMYLYNPQEGIEWGDYLSSPRLDDLQSAFGLVKGFIESSAEKAINIYCLFDNEEVGSTTKQGAASTFLMDVLDRICSSFGYSKDEKIRMLANSFMISCDNAHAEHPNHPEIRDPNHSPRMNGGIVIKYNAAQHYTTDAVSASVFKLVCEKAGVPYQMFANRADQRGGGTLGNISTSQVSVNTVDIGIAQLAMHSSFETSGAKDTEYLVNAMKTYYGSALEVTEDGVELL